MIRISGLMRRVAVFHSYRGNPYYTGLKCRQHIMLRLWMQQVVVQVHTPVYGSVNPAPSFVWTGLTSSDWNVVTNWISGVVPGLTDVSTIPATGVVHYPVITGTADLGPTVIESGASMSVAPGGVLNVLDVFANNGTLTLMSDVTGDGVLMDTAAGAQFSGSIVVERYNPGSNSIF